MRWSSSRIDEWYEVGDKADMGRNHADTRLVLGVGGGDWPPGRILTRHGATDMTPKKNQGC